MGRIFLGPELANDEFCLIIDCISRDSAIDLCLVLKTFFNIEARCQEVTVEETKICGGEISTSHFKVYAVVLKTLGPAIDGFFPIYITNQVDTDKLLSLTAILRKLETPFIVNQSLKVGKEINICEVVAVLPVQV